MCVCVFLNDNFFTFDGVRYFREGFHSADEPARLSKLESNIFQSATKDSFIHARKKKKKKKKNFY